MKKKMAEKKQMQIERVMGWLIMGLLWFGCMLNGIGGAPMLRDEISLNGNWPTGGQVPRYDAQNVEFDTKRFERTFTVPAEWKNKRIKLEFYAVNYYCDVFIDGAKIGSHTGAWVPFDFDITSRVTPGKTHTLRVDVTGKLLPPTIVDGEVLWWIGHNDLDKKRCGIYDDVWLRAYGLVHIDDTFIITSYRKQEIEVRYTVKNTTSSSWTGKIVGDIIREKTGVKEKTISSNSITLAAGEERVVTVKASWTNPALWWPDQPNLYHLVSRLENSNGVVVDKETRRFGFREFWIEGTQFRLNGIRVNLRGDWCCFTQYWGTITNEATLRKHYEGVKATNANILRWHKHPAPKFAYDLADEMGIMVLAEDAFYGRDYYKYWNHRTIINNIKKILPAFVRQFRNHPSVVMWSASNEVTYKGLGNFNPLLVKELGDLIYSLDPTRPVSYDGDVTVPGVIYNKHYPEGYEKDPIGNPYTAWINHIATDKPTYFGEMLAVRPDKNNNGWWIGVWPRGLRYLEVAGIAPRVYYPGDRITPEQEALQKLAYHPVALFDRAYDELGIAPYKDKVYPTIDEGATIKRTLYLYNDEYRDTSVTCEVLIRVEGTVYASGSKTYTLPLGEKREITIQFQAPKLGGKRMELVLRTKKAGVTRFEQIHLFNLKEVGQSGSTSNLVIFDGGENKPPVIQEVNCVPNPINGWNGQAELKCTATDDRGESNLTYTWSVISKPSGAGTPTFSVNGTNAAKVTTVTFSGVGTYVFRVTVKDQGGLTATRDIEVKVDPIKILTDVSQVTVPEGGTATFRVKLSAIPFGSVMVNIARTSGDTDLRLKSSTPLTFNSTNWNTWQTVTLEAIEDQDTEDGSAIFTCSANGFVSVSVTAYESDNDVKINQPPVVSFKQPVANLKLLEPADLYVEVLASDVDGTVQNVKLYLNGELVRQENTAPYDWGPEKDPQKLKGLKAGTYILRAVATDNGGLMAEAQCQVIVQAVPVISFKEPLNNAIFLAPADVNVEVLASDSDGTIQNVKLYLNGEFVRQENTAPYTWNAEKDPQKLKGLKAGSYTLRAVATDNDGLAAEVQCQFTVRAKPSVSFKQPVNNATFTEPANISVEVLASDVDGTVQNVKLYLNGEFVRQENTAPYTWNAEKDSQKLKGLKAGTYTLRAVATDNDGLTSEAQCQFVVQKPVNGIIQEGDTGSSSGTSSSTSTVVKTSRSKKGGCDLGMNPSSWVEGLLLIGAILLMALHRVGQRVEGVSWKWGILPYSHSHGQR